VEGERDARDERQGGEAGGDGRESAHGGGVGPVPS